MSTFPSEALDWLAVWGGVRGLTVGDDASLPRRLAGRGHQIFALTPDEALVARLNGYGNITPLHARAEAIPLDPFQFEVVFTHQAFHKLDRAQALPQIARVLRPGGCLSASYLIRDDSVPWVRRLAALLRRYDPVAMKGDYGHQSLESLRESHYFPEIEERAFRIWQPVTRDDMANMVRHQPLARHLDGDQLDRLVEQVLELYDAAARPGENLKLPFQLLCWRAWVDHAELTNPVQLPDNGLAIKV
ncbi:class I SAM-dependent methyltransferase [Tessaracoccus oleiagri]|uniref:Methyltransferase domain-containing protein n=1 Tax=Tessaracoccus oleiagri TaxID=686624 RepID=A0A1G9MZ32_9ACTN|nr:class I SAM-dependent methyltransferase [Tessaracoccus oleiagri]SDL79576.1 Methyltransferase domain-containing protein [Tessaracoccus oleiagri]